MEEAKWSVVFDFIERSEKAVITAVSYAALADVLRERKMSKGKTIVIYNGVDLSKFELNHG